MARDRRRRRPFLMPQRSRQRANEGPRMAPRLPLFLAGVLLLGACSVLLDKTTTQCQSDADCARFPVTTCDLRAQVCVARAADAGMVDANAATAAPDAAD